MRLYGPAYLPNLHVNPFIDHIKFLHVRVWARHHYFLASHVVWMEVSPVHVSMEER